MPRRALLAGLGALVLLVASAFFVELEVPGLAGAVLDRSREETGLAIEASRSRLNLLEGLSLEEVRASARTGVGGYDVHLDRIRFEHRPLALLAGRFEIRRVVLERPRIALLPQAAVGSAGESPAPSGRAARRGAREENSAGGDERASAEAEERRRGLGIARAPSFAVSMTGASFRLGEGLVTEGLDVHLLELDYDRRALTPLHGLSSRGTTRIAGIAFEKLRLEGVEAKLRTEGGRIELEALRFRSPRGSFEGALALDFNVIPFRYRIELASADFEIAPLGKGRLHLSAEGFGSGSRNLTGEGTLELGPGALSDDPPIVGALDPDLAGAEYRASPARLEIGRNLVRIEGLRLEGASFELALEGAIEIDGPLDLTVTLKRGDGTRLYSITGARDAPVVTRRGS